MLTEPRRYRTQRDVEQMAALLQAGRAANIASYYIHTGDLQWWLYYPPLDGSLWEHIYLWEDAAQGRLLGWTLIDPEGATFDVYCQPDLHGTQVFVEMLAWAQGAAIGNAAAAGQKRISMYWVIPQDGCRIHWLEEQGYRVASESPLFARSLTGPIPAAPVPDGFTVRSCRGLAEVTERARAQYGAFASTAPFDRYSERFASFMQSPAYAPDSDVVAAAPDGQLAAFAITWADPRNRVGLFEPVGTHPDFQRKGLGRAVMLEAFRRLHAQGMERAIVTTADFNTAAIELYKKVGFVQENEFRVYTKDLG